MRLEFSSVAAADLDEILEYIAQDNPRRGRAFVELLREKCQLLAQFPEMGARRDDLADGIRVFSVGAYAVFYRQAESILRIERVLHGARDAESLL